MQSAKGQRKSLIELQSLIDTFNKGKPAQQRIKRTPKFRFRALVRTVMNNLKWLLEGTTSTENIFPKQLNLTREAKALLRIPVEDRTAEEQEIISKQMGLLVCFDRYPEKVRESLTAAASYNYFPPGRVMVAEGHPSVAMYFILSGEAIISKSTFDAGVKKFLSEDIGTITEGSAFGEINILHDEPWPTTVTTATHVEILTVRKENFQMILEEFLGVQQREITRCLNQFIFFKNWNQRTIVECCILARVVHYEKNNLIVGENYGDPENAYFIVSGTCRVIYHLQVEVVSSNKKNFNELKIINTDTVTEMDSFPASFTVRNVERPRKKQIAEPIVTGLIVDKVLTQLISELPLSELESEKKFVKKRVRSHFLQVAELRAGACFAIGESLDKKFILSDSHLVTVLCIPKFFLKIHSMGNIWGRVKELYNHLYPSPQVIFNEFLVYRKWCESRRKYMETLIKPGRPFTGLTSAEAPYFTRLTQDFENPIFQRIREIVTEESKD